MPRAKSLDARRTLTLRASVKVADVHTISKGLECGVSVAVQRSFVNGDTVVDADNPLVLDAASCVVVHAYSKFIVDIGGESFPCDGYFAFTGAIRCVVRSETPLRVLYNLC